MHGPTALTRQILRRTAFASPRVRQRGMVAVVTVLFLIATVLFALSQMRNVSGSNVADSQRQADSTAAFFLAESGLETGQAAYSAAIGGALISNTSCTGIASNFNLAGGTVNVSATSEPVSCSGLACLACQVKAIGHVGVSTREVTRRVILTTNNGVACNSSTSNCTNSSTVNWKLNLENTSAYNAVAYFNLTYLKQGNATPTCVTGVNCPAQQDISSPSNGANSTGLMGNIVPIAAGGQSTIYQTFASNKNTDLVEVGVLFKGSTVAPAVTGPGGAGGASYWHRSNTVGSAGTTGSTNDGTFTANGACTSSNPTSDPSQACTNWCYSGDTLVFGYAGNVNALADQLTSVTFNTVAMTKVMKYPTAGIAGAPARVDAEIWYAGNPNLVGSSPLGVNASSYKGRGSGAVGAQWTSNNSDTTAVAGGILTVGASFTGYPTQVISAGDTVSYTAGAGSPTCVANAVCGTVGTQVTPLLGGEQTGGKGRYNLTGAVAVGSANNRVWTIKSAVLRVSACTVCDFQNGDGLTGLVSGRTINAAQAGLNNAFGLTEAGGGIGRYPISGLAAFVASAGNLYAGTPGTTLYLPAASNQPSLTTPAMRIAIKSGTGVLAANTTVTSVSAVGSPNAVTRSFVVSAAPTTALDFATLCAGTCAFFVPNGTTNFSIVKSAGTNEWASAFMCLKGVDITPELVTSSSPAIRTWTETIH